jgi:hypothetical protein
MSPQRPLKRSVWRSRALCAGLPLELFFEPENEPEAVRVCNLCEVRQECLAEAVLAARTSTYEIEGVFGGLNKYQRSKLRGKIK